jgi:SAM-dependent methyltransferase
MSFFLREQPTFTGLSSTDVEWEECPCLLCGNRPAIPLLEAPDRIEASGKWFLVVQCPTCGLCFTNPRPSEASMALLCGDALPPRLPSFRRTSRAGRRGFGYRRVIAPHGQKRLLDFGCGAGSFLQRMHSCGWAVQGLDTSAEAIQHIRDDLGLPALTGSLPHELLEPGSFDAITMWQSLQYVRWPLETLKAARRLLAPGGKVIIAAPNIDSLPFRVFGPAWSGLNLPRHLTHFAPWTLSLLLRRAGFRPGKIRMVRRGRWLRASANLAYRHHAEPPRMLRWLRGKTAADLTAWYSYLTRQSDCIMVTAEANG